MKRTKKNLSIILAVATAISMSGCSAGKVSQESISKVESGAVGNSAGEKIELTFWNRSSSADNIQAITMEEFNQSQDRIHVNIESYGDNYEEVLKLAINSGDVPDIFEIASNSSFSQCAETGVVVPLDDYLAADPEFESKFNPSEFTLYGGNVYAIPNMLRYVRLYYNKDLFEQAGLNPEEPPKTLEEMYDAAKAITEAGDGEFYGFGFPMKSASTWERNVDLVSILSGQTGPYAFDYMTGKFDFAKEKRAIEYFAKMHQDGLMMPGSESQDIEVLRANFVSNKIGMYFDGNWMVNGYNNEIEGGDVTNWDTALVPVFEGTKRAKDYMMLDISGHCISASSEHKEECFEAIKYLVENLYYAPARKSPDLVSVAYSLIKSDNETINSTEEVQKMKGVKGVMEDVDNLSRFPIIPNSVLTLEGDSRDVVYPLLILQSGSMDIDAELQKLTDTYNSALKNAVAEGLLNEADLKPEGFNYYTR